MNLNDVNEAKSAIVAILKREALAEVTGMELLKQEERSFLLATCCARLIEQEVSRQAHFRADQALEGLQSLYEDMRRHVLLLCGASGTA